MRSRARHVLVAILAGATGSCYAFPRDGHQITVTDAGIRRVDKSLHIAPGHAAEAVVFMAANDEIFVSFTATALVHWNIHQHPKGGTGNLYDEITIAAEHRLIAAEAGAYYLLWANQHNRETISVEVFVEMSDTTTWGGFAR